MGIGVGQNASAATSCQWTHISSLAKGRADAANLFHRPKNAKLALKIMMDGSLNVSRTKVVGRRFIAPAEVADSQIAVIAESNFKKAAEFVIKNFETLGLNLETAVTLNKILTEGLVPEINRGKYDYRVHGSYVGEIDSAIGRSPRDFYITWLNSREAKLLFKKSPIEFAEIVHNSVMSLDSFPDGNGRLSRLFADLALIKSNLAPAYYTSMTDYFERGNSRSEVNREVRKNYFYEIVIKGMSLFKLGMARIFPQQNHSENSLAA